MSEVSENTPTKLKWSFTADAFPSCRTLRTHKNEFLAQQSVYSFNYFGRLGRVKTNPYGDPHMTKKT